MSIRKQIALTVSLFTVSMLSAHSAFSQESISVKLEKIEVIQSQEKRGDELYISVTEFPKAGSPKHYQVPNFPTHWLSAHLADVKDITLWEKSFKSCEDTKIIFSLVEQDLAPWNLDDLMGSVQLNLSCEKGKVISRWSIPNPSITQFSPKDHTGFSFTGDKGQYQIKFKIEQNAIAAPKK